MFDFLIRGGTLVDGTGQPRFVADVAIQGDRIAAVGQLQNASAARVIQAHGKIIAPGLIDIHTHSDTSIFANPRAESTVRQGVTTEVMGNCGATLAPVSDVNRSSVEASRAMYFPDTPLTWSSFGEYLDVVEACRPSINLVALVGHNRVRSAVSGMAERLATAEEISHMADYVMEAMEAGAAGLSTGLEFLPGRGCNREELVMLSKVAATYGGVLTSHIRNRDRHLEAATEEILDVAKQSAISLQISHFDAKPGHPDGAWERSVAQMETARAQGLDVHADCQNYHGGPGFMSGILPPWLTAEGPEKAVELMKDPAVRAQLRTQCDRYWLMPHLGQWDRVWLGRNRNSRQYIGVTFDRIAAFMGKDPWDAYFDILVAEGPNFADIWWDGIYYDDQHLDDQALHPLYMYESDCWTASETGPLADMVTYPNHFGWAVRFIIRYCRDRHLLSLEEVVRKMTLMPADKFRLKGRGRIAPDMMADLVVFDLARLEERATYEHPRRYARGIDYVFVNGVLTIENEEHLGARAGRLLRRGVGALV